MVVPDDAFPYDDGDLARFREVQRLAYDIAEEVAASLEVGMTERDACAAIAAAQRARGVEQVFHFPFAWFGERTMLSPGWAQAGMEGGRGADGRGAGCLALFRPRPFRPLGLAAASGGPAAARAGSALPPAGEPGGSAVPSPPSRPTA